MQAYVLLAAPTQWDNWGDYANILVHGMSAHLSRRDGLLQVERVGPYVPAVTLPGVSDILLTEQAKAFVESRLPGTEFRPVILAKCVRLDWTTWDASQDEPAEYPESGEPEDYILSSPHDAALAAEVGPLWELVPEVVDGVQGREGRLRAGVYQGQPLVRAALLGGYNFVSEELRDVLLAAAPDCLTFREARVEDVQQSLPSERPIDDEGGHGAA